MNAWTQTCTAVLDNSASALTSPVTTHVNARMDCTTSTTLAKVREHNIYLEPFSVECLKTKTKLWPFTRKSKQSSGPIKTQIKYM